MNLTMENRMNTKYTDTQNAETQTKKQWLDEIESEGHNLNVISLDENGDEVSEEMSVWDYFEKMVDEKFLVEAL